LQLVLEGGERTFAALGVVQEAAGEEEAAGR